MTRTWFYVVVVLVFTLIFASGLAYAQFSSANSLNVTASAGTVYLQVTAVQVQSYRCKGHCAITISGTSALPSQSVSFTIGSFTKRRDYATVNFTLENTGSLPVILTVIGPTVQNPSGTTFTASLGPVHGASLGAGSSYTFNITIAANHVKHGSSATITFSVVASVGGQFTSTTDFTITAET